MGMSGNGMGQAVYNWVAANNPDFSSLSSSEKSAFLSQLQGYYGAVVGYIQGNAVVPAGISVVVGYPSGVGDTTGTGSVQ